MTDPAQRLWLVLACLRVALLAPPPDETVSFSSCPRLSLFRQGVLQQLIALLRR